MSGLKIYGANNSVLLSLENCSLLLAEYFKNGLKYFSEIAKLLHLWENILYPILWSAYEIAANYH